MFRMVTKMSGVAAVSSQSALIVLVPEAAPVVGPYRQRLDPRAALGVPEHVTILYPFLPPEALDRNVSRRLRALFAAASPFDFALEEVRWFGSEVMWLAPEPAGPFVTLTEQVVAAFGILPYDGDHGAIMPHLTVAISDGSAAGRAVELELTEQLPIKATVDRVHLAVCDEQGRWMPQEEFTLGAV